MTPSLEGLPTKAKEAPSPHEVRLAPLDTNPVFQSLWDKMLAIMVGWRLNKTWWPKHPKVAPLHKKRLHLNGTDDSNIKMIQNLIFVVLLSLLKILFLELLFLKLSRMTNDSLSNCIFIHTFQWTSSLFFSFTFSRRKSLSQKLHLQIYASQFVTS